MKLKQLLKKMSLTKILLILILIHQFLELLYLELHMALIQKDPFRDILFGLMEGKLNILLDFSFLFLPYTKIITKIKYFIH